MRKSVDGLAAIVNLSLACDFSGESMFIFCNKTVSYTHLTLPTILLV